MTRHHNTARANSDLLEIGRFTQLRWGRKARIQYLARIQSMFDSLTVNSNLGRNRDEVIEGVLSLPVGRHLIIHKVEKTGLIIVIRVLHQSMDYRNQLLDEGRCDLPAE